MKGGCPFTDFGPCAKKGCKFYFPRVKEKCLIIAMADLTGKNNAILVELLQRSEED